jgi:nitrogen fixation/metabolism regulation signal transduction histidine kinase
VLLTALTIGAGSLDWMGTLGPWDRVGESGRTLFDAAATAAEEDSVLAGALEQHRRELSTSLVQASRWSFLGERLATMLPIALAISTLLLALLALWVSRRMARQLARPVRDLVQLTEMLAAGEPLPPGRPPRRRDVREMRVLREALYGAAARIEEARARALEAERVRAWGEMARRVAHEMKNPLTPLRLAAYRLRRAAADHGELAEPVEVIEQESARLEELARSFAVLGRPPEGPPSDVDIAELLRSIAHSDVPAGIRVEVKAPTEPPVVRGHYDPLLRAFRNLLRNAVEAVRTTHGEQGGSIEMHVTRAGDEIEVVVADDGRGVPAEALERIFEADYTLKAGGTGLGLAVVRQAVGAHGGHVRAHQRAGGGAAFIVRLPLDGTVNGSQHEPPSRKQSTGENA